MHCAKLPGQRLSARDFDRQVAEFQLRVAVLNGFTARNTHHRWSQDRAGQGKAQSVHQPICATESVPEHIIADKLNSAQ